MKGVGSEKVPWLHIRSQFTYHAEAEIKGTRAGLEALRDAVAAALANGAARCEAFASDGEGYDVEVTRSSTLRGIGKPTYLDEEARELAYHEREFLVRQSRHNKAVTREAFEALRWCRANGDPHKEVVE